MWDWFETDLGPITGADRVSKLARASLTFPMTFFNSDHTEQFGRIGHFYGRKIGRLVVNPGFNFRHVERLTVSCKTKDGKLLTFGWRGRWLQVTRPQVYLELATKTSHSSPTFDASCWSNLRPICAIYPLKSRNDFLLIWSIFSLRMYSFIVECQFMFLQTDEIK